MKKIILSIISFALTAGISASAQDLSGNEQASNQAMLEEIQKKLDASGNPYGVRVESYSLEQVEPMLPTAESSDSTGSNGKGILKAALRILDMHKYIITYMSFDGKRDSIRVSAAVYFKKDYYYESMLLACHPTVTSTFEAPTGGGPVDGDIKRICDEGFLVVCPDYCGYGITAYRQHPYLIHDVTARNCIDGCMAALDFAKNGLGKYPNDEDWFDTSIVGYSQGGATALACHKYLESDICPSKVKETLNLFETCCGDGPYSTIATVNQYIKWGQEGKGLEYPCVLPLIVAAAKEAYGDGCMRTVEVEDYFTEKFLATGIIDMLKNKNLTTTDLNLEISKKMTRVLPIDIFSDKIILPDGSFNTETNEYKCLMRAMETNELASGWVPQNDIIFYHLPGDGVVPYANLQAVKEGIMKDNPHVEEVTPKEAHAISIDRISQFLAQLSKGLLSPDYNTISHAKGGVLFYIDYLFGAFLRYQDDDD